MENKKKVVSILFISFVVVVCFTYLYSKGTYTIYESKIQGDITPDIATWSIKVNDMLVTTEEVSTVDISSVTWTSDHIVADKVGPGAVGSLNINIDPMDTDVAIRYDLEIIDKSVDSLKILTVNSISDVNNELVKTGVSTYTGVITLDDIKNKNINTVSLSVEWIDDGTEIVYEDEAPSNEEYLSINFKATQYTGEEIVPFTE